MSGEGNSSFSETLLLS